MCLNKKSLNLGNTLLGLRLFQADILIINSEATDLPKDNGKYLLGKGEDEPNLFLNSLMWNGLLKQQIKLDKEFSGRYNSYIICDYEQQVTFYENEGNLVLTGYPVWYCWKNKISDKDQRKRFVEKMNNEINANLQKKYNKKTQRRSYKDNI